MMANVSEVDGSENQNFVQTESHDEITPAENVLDEEDDDIDLDDLQILDECGEDDEDLTSDVATDCVEAKASDGSKSTTKRTPSNENPQIEKNRSGSGAPNKEKSSANSGKSLKQDQVKIRRDETKEAPRRSDQTSARRNRGVSKSRSRSRSNSSPRRDRRRSRSRSPRRSSGTKSPEKKKPETSKDKQQNAKAIVKQPEKTKIQATPTEKNSSIPSGSKTKVPVTPAAKNSSSAAKTKPQEMPAKKNSSTSPSKKQAQYSSKGGQAKAQDSSKANKESKQQPVATSLKGSPSQATDPGNAASVEPKPMEEKAADDEAMIQTAPVENESEIPTISSVSAHTSTDRSQAAVKQEVASNLYDGDILEIAVPDDAFLEDGLGSSSASVINESLTECAPIPVAFSNVSSINSSESASVKEHDPSTSSAADEGRNKKEVDSAVPHLANSAQPNFDEQTTAKPSPKTPKDKGPATAPSTRQNRPTPSKKQPPATNGESGKKASTSKAPVSCASKTNVPSGAQQGEKRKLPVETAKATGPSSPVKKGKPNVPKASGKMGKADGSSKGQTPLSNVAKMKDGSVSVACSGFPMSLVPRRDQPLPQIKNYVDSIRNLEYDVKVYCCFYCVACPLLLPTTPRYEEHLNSSMHKQNVAHWRISQDIQGESLKPFAKRQLDVDNFAETIVGADQIVEICTSEGIICNYVCTMCASCFPDIDSLLSHLTSFLHVENYMEKLNSNIFVPPAISCSQFESMTLSTRKDDPAHVEKVFSAARTHMLKHGRGCMSSYNGDKYHDVHSSAMSELDEMEETIMMSLMEQLFAGDGSYKTRWNRADAALSVGNRIYEEQPKELQERIVGLQTVLEIWFPNRRMPPVFYCMACNYMVTNVVNHCSVTKHWIEYFDKCYKTISDCLLLEADDEQMLKESLVTAVKHVSQLEGGAGRIQNVIQILVDPGVIFCAVNALIAKQIVDEMGLKTIPARLPSTSQQRPSSSKSDQKVKSGEATQTSKTGNSPSKKPVVASGVGKKPLNAAADKKTVPPVRVSAVTKAPAQGQLRPKLNTTLKAPIKKPLLRSPVKATPTAKQQPPRDNVVRRPLQRPLPRDDRKLERRSTSRPSRESRSPQSTRRDQKVVRKEDARVRPRFVELKRAAERRRQANYSTSAVLSRQPKPRKPLLSQPPSRMEQHRPERRRQHSPVPDARGSRSSLAVSSHRQFSNSERPNYQRDEYRGPDSSSEAYNSVGPEDLLRLTDVLRTYVGLDFGRVLTEEDLVHVRDALPPGTLDELLELLRRAPTMSFHNFFAEHGAGVPVGLGEQIGWPMSNDVGQVANAEAKDERYRGRTSGEGERSSRKSSFGSPYESRRGQHQRSSKHDDGHYSQRRAAGRHDRLSSENDGPSRRVTRSNRGDDQPGALPIGASSQFGHGGAPALTVYDVIKNYENASSMAGNAGVVYAQPFFPQQPPPNVLGGVYGRTQGHDGSSVSYGVPIQGLDNSSVYLPVVPPQSNAPDFWHQPHASHPRHGSSREYGKKY